MKNEEFIIQTHNSQLTTHKSEVCFSSLVRLLSVLYDEYDERKLTPGTSWFAVGRDGKASPIAQLVRAPH